jgi:tetratricopeptide (TPR) repeat protein
LTRSAVAARFCSASQLPKPEEGIEADPSDILADYGVPKTSEPTRGLAADLHPFFEHVEFLIRTEKFGDALKMLGTIPETAPTEMKVVGKMQTLQCHLQLQQFHEALTVCQQLTSMKASAPSIKYAEGRAHFGCGHFQQAIVSLTTFLDTTNEAQFPSKEKYDELVIDSLVMRGSAYLNLGDPSMCIRDMDRVLKLTPGSNEALFFKANALRLMGRFQDSISLYDTLLASNHHDDRALYGRSLASAAAGNAADALWDVEQAIAHHDSVEYLLHKARILLRSRGDYVAALELFEHVVKVIAGFRELPATERIRLLVAAHSGRASALMCLQRWDDALKVLDDEVLAISRDHVLALNNKAYCYIQQGRFHDAVDACNRAMTVDASYPDVFRNRAVAWSHLGRYEDAVADLTKSKDLVRKSPDAWKSFVQSFSTA